MSLIRYRWIILLLAYLCVLEFAFTLQSVPAILTSIIEELGLSHAEAGSLMSLFALPMIFLGVLSGSLCDRLGSFKIGSLSLIILIVGTLVFAVSGTFLCAALARAVAGIGAATTSIVAAQIVCQWFTGREVGTAMGILNTAMPLGTIISLASFGKLAHSSSWRVPILITAIMGAVALAAFMTLYKQPSNLRQETRSHRKENVAGLLSRIVNAGGLIWLVGVCWMWFNAAAISFLTFAQDFLMGKGYSVGSGGFLAGLLMWGSLALSPIVGRLVDKVSNNDVFIGIGGIGMAGAFYFISRSANVVFPILVLAVAAAFVPASVYSLPSKILAPENFGLGFGVLSTASSVGMVFAPYAAGLIRDKTKSYELSFIFLSLLAVLMTTTALILRITMVKTRTRPE